MRRIVLAVSSLALMGTFAIADPREDREALMKSFGKALSVIAPMAQEQQPFDAAQVQAALAELNTQAQKLDVAALFPEGSDSARTSPAIWENMPDFQARVDKFKADVAAAAGAPAADLATLKTQLGAVGSNCGTCHEAYRLNTN